MNKTLNEKAGLFVIPVIILFKKLLEVMFLPGKVLDGLKKFYTPKDSMLL